MGDTYDDYTPPPKPSDAIEGEGPEVEDEGLVADDPFSPQHAPAFMLITLMRIYDVGMALLNEKSPETAAKLHKHHSQGNVVFSFPYLSPDE